MVVAADGREMLSVRDVARALKIRTETVRMWARSGRLRGCRISSQRWRFDPADVADFIEAGKNTSKTDRGTSN
jgi:excisionase family DNA binding protein